MKRDHVLVKHHYRCVGHDCPTPCYEECPVQALSLKRNPTFDAMGDFRWTPDLLVSTWHMAETGDMPAGGLEYKIGESGGGFDKMRLLYPPKEDVKDTLDLQNEEMDVGVELNRLNDNAHKVRIEVPFYGGGMSYGSISITTMLSRIVQERVDTQMS
jgi:hypothetical protein